MHSVTEILAGLPKICQCCQCFYVKIAFTRTTAHTDDQLSWQQAPWSQIELRLFPISLQHLEDSAEVTFNRNREELRTGKGLVNVNSLLTTAYTASLPSCMKSSKTPRTVLFICFFIWLESPFKTQFCLVWRIFWVLISCLGWIDRVQQWRGRVSPSGWKTIRICARHGRSRERHEPCQSKKGLCHIPVPKKALLVVYRCLFWDTIINILCIACFSGLALNFSISKPPLILFICPQP